MFFLKFVTLHTVHVFISVIRAVWKIVVGLKKLITFPPFFGLPQHYDFVNPRN